MKQEEYNQTIPYTLSMPSAESCFIFSVGAAFLINFLVNGA